MKTRGRFTSLVVVGILLTLGSTPSSKGIAPLWNYRIENMTDFAMSRNGEYVIVACEKGPLCERGQFYVFDRYGNTITYDCIDSEITAVDIADNGAFFIGTRNGYYFSSTSGRILEDTNGSIFESVSISENGEIVIAGTDKEIFLFDNQGIMGEKEIGRPVNLTATSASGNIAVAGTKDKIHLYEKSTDTWTDLLTNGTVTALAVSDDGSTILCGMSTGIIWILDTYLNIQVVTRVEGGVISIAMTADKDFVCCTQKNKLFYLNSSGNEIWSAEMKNEVKIAAITFDGNLVAALSRNIILFDSSGKKLHELEPSEIIQDMKLSKFGEILFYISDEKLIFLELYQKSRVETYEYMLPSRRSIPLDDQLVEVWSFDETSFGGIVADINGDGQNEIICGLDRGIVALDSKGKVLWKKSFAFKSGFTIVDLTSDLVPEIVVKSNDNRMGIYVLDNEGQEITSHEFYSRWYSEPPSEEDSLRMEVHWSGDIDNDEFIEVVCLVYAGYILEPRGLYVFEYPSFKEEWYYPVAPYLATLNFVDINGDGEIEIIAGSGAPCNGRQIGDTDDCHAYIYAVTLQGKELWTRQIGPGKYGRVHIAVADLEDNGSQEIVGGGWSFEDNWGTLFVLDSNGNYVFGEGSEFENSVFLEGIADLDDDGDLEILTSSSPSTLILYDHKLKEIRSQNVSIVLDQNSFVTINDIDGDGEKEIILTSEDEKLLILNTNLEEVWSKTFPSYYKFPRVKIVTLSKCKNYLLVFADKLHTYTYSNNPDWPCIPWVIIEQQKIAEAEDYIEDGDKCIEEKDCECAKAGFSQAKNSYELIQNEESIEQIEEKIEIAEACFTFNESLEEAKRLFGEADEVLNVIYISKPEEYFSEAEEYIFTIEEELKKAEEAYEFVWKTESKEIEEYYTKIGEIRNAMNYFDTGKKQIEEGRTNEAEENLRKAMEIFNNHKWSEHVGILDRLLLNISTPPPTGKPSIFDNLQIIGAISSVIGVVLFLFQGKIKRYFSRKKADTFFEQGERDYEKGDLGRAESSLKQAKSKYETIEDAEKTKECDKWIDKIHNQRKKEILDYHIERIEGIKAKKMPCPLVDAAKIVLHIVPFNAFDPSNNLDLASLPNEKELPPLCGPSYTPGHHQDPNSFLVYWNHPQTGIALSYVQILDNGIIEAADALLLDDFGEKHIPQGLIEKTILDALKEYLSFHKKIGVEPPLFIMLSYLGVQGYTIINPIKESDLLAPEVVVNNFEDDIVKVMKPIFDAIRKASGALHQ
ncbi:MAG: PQQ-binding-like beta-propeller repeat protein [Theionarchaea archaeon]|nr:PQQ-binding-like beta-propeller repeat protein [Theionarchaea archaeon]